MNARLNWYGDDALNRMKAAAWEGIVRATEFLFAQLLLTLNVSNPRPHKTPAAPGEPPRKRTGFLQANVQREYDADALRSRVGISANALYGAFLELGTRMMAPRPWLLATVDKVWGQLQALAVSGRAEE